MPPLWVNSMDYFIHRRVAMAKNTKNEKLSDLLKDPSFNFDSFDSPTKDEIPDFDFDFGANTDTKANRSPIAQVRQGAAAALSSTATHFAGGLKTQLEQRMPDASRFVGETAQFTSDMMHLGSEFQKELGPSILQLKRAGQALGPRIKQFLPKSWQQKYDDLVSTKDDKDATTKKISKEDTENLAITQSIDSIFSKNFSVQAKREEEQFKDQKTDTLIDRSLASKRHAESFQQFHQIATGISFQQRFIEQIQIPLMKKELELKYRHFFVARDTLTELKGLAKIVEQSLAQIRHNTALPDIQKQTRLESIKDEHRQRLAGFVNNWVSEVGKRVKERFLTPTAEMIEQLASGAEMLSSTVAMEDELGGGPKGIGATVGGPLGMLLGNRASKKLSKLLFGEQFGNKGIFGSKLIQANHFFKNFTARMGMKAQDYADNHEGEFLGEVASLFSPALSRKLATATNVQLKKPDDPATLTNQAVLSITQIIPGYLAKAVKHLETIATGQPADELVWSQYNNDWIRAKDVQSQFVVEAMGGIESRNRVWAERIGRVRGIAQVDLKSEHWLSDFTKIEDDLRTWIANSIYSQKPPIPAAIAELADMTIKKAAESSDDDDAASWFDDFLSNISRDSSRTTSYFIETFKNVKNPVALLQFLKQILFRSDGSVNDTNYRSVTNIILEGMGDKRFEDVFQRYIKSGMARYMPDLIEHAGSTIAAKNEKLQAFSLQGVSRYDKTYQSTRKYEARRAAELQSYLTDSLDLEDVINDPAFNEGVIGKANQFIRGWILENPETYSKIKDKGQSLKTTVKEKFVPSAVKSWVKKYAPRALGIYEQVEKDAQKTTQNIAKRMEAIRKQSDGRNVRYTSDQAVMDNYIARNNPRLGRVIDSDTRSILSGIIASGLATGDRTTINFPSDIKITQSQDQVLDVNVLNFEDFVSHLNQSLANNLSNIQVKTALPEAPKDHDKRRTDIVDAIKSFEDKFLDYAGHQAQVQELLSSVAAATSALSGQMDVLLQNSRSTLGKMASAVGKGVTAPFRFAKKHLQKVHPIGWSIAIAKKSWDLNKSLVKKTWHLGGKIVPPTMRGLGTGLGWAWDKNKKLAKRAWELGLDVTGLTLEGMHRVGQGIDGALTDSLTAYGQLKERGRQFGTRVLDRVRGARRSVKNKAMRLRYVDIYLKDQIDEANPLLSAVKQSEGVYFVDTGNRVLTSFSIDKPVKEIITDSSGAPTSSRILITKENIEHGLVDVNNKPIGGARSLIGKAVGMTFGAGAKIGKGILGATGYVGNLVKDLLEGKNPLAKLWIGAAGLGLKGIGALGSGIAKVGRRVFGLGENVNKEVLHDVVGTRLDIIIAILKNKFGLSDGDIKVTTGVNGPTVSVRPTGEDAQKPTAGDVAPGDADGDGKRDTIFEDRANMEKRKAEKEETRLRHGFYKTMISLKDKLLGSGKEKKGGFFSKVLEMLKHPIATLRSIGKVVTGMFPMVGLIGTTMVKAVKGIFGLPMMIARYLGPLLLGKSSIGDFLPGGKKGKGKGKKVPKGKGGGFLKSAANFFKGGGWKSKMLAAGLGGAAAYSMFGDDEAEAAALASENEEMEAPDEMSPEHWEAMASGGQPGSNASTAAGATATAAVAKPGGGATPFQVREVETGATSLGDVAKSLGSWAGVKMLIKQAAKWGLKRVGLKALTLAGTMVAGGPLAAVLGPGALALSVIDDLFFGGKYQQHALNYLGIGEDEFVLGRCDVYGVPTSGWSIKNVFGGSICRQVVKLEEDTYATIQGTKGPFTEDEISEWTDRFGLDAKKPEQRNYWMTWYVRRFIPGFKAYIRALKNNGFKFEDSYDVPVERKNMILKVMETEVKKALGKNGGDLVPTKEGFTRFAKDFQKDKNKTTQASAAAANAQETQSSTNVKENLPLDQKGNTLKNVNNPSGFDAAALKKALGDSPMINRMFNSGSANTTIMDGTPGATGEVGGGNIGSGAGAGAPPDMSGVNPANLKSKDGELGSYVKRFESGKGGTATIGYDGPGGTSYGSYQLSSKMGSLAEFVNWLRNKSPEAYNVLYPMLNQANTGSRQGAFPNAWLQLVKEGKITHELEHEFFMNKFYGKALSLIQKANPEMAQWIQSNRALQECLWSSAVQHGPAGALRLFRDHYKPGIDVPTFLRNYYSNRFTAKYFPRLAKSEPGTLRSLSNHRAKDELAVMLSLAGEQPANPDGSKAGTAVADNQQKEIQDPGSTPSGSGAGTKTVAANNPQMSTEDSNQIGTGGVSAKPVNDPNTVAAGGAPAQAGGGSGAMAVADSNQIGTGGTSAAPAQEQPAAVASAPQAPAVQMPNIPPPIDYSDRFNNLVALMSQMVQLQAQLPAELQRFMTALRESMAGYPGTFAGTRSMKSA